MRHHSSATTATQGTVARRSGQRSVAHSVMLWSAAALLAAGAVSAELAGGSSQQGGPPPVAPGDLLASTGNQGDSMIDVDPTTGEGTFRSSLGEFGPVSEIVYRIDGELFGSTGKGTGNLIMIDADTGEETLVGTHKEFGALNGLEFVDDTLYGSFLAPDGPPTGGGGGPPSFLVTVDQKTAELSAIGEIAGFTPVRGLAYDPSSGVLYGVGRALIDGEPVDSVLLTIDRATGAGTIVGPIGHAVGGIRFGPDDVLYGGTVDPEGESGGSLITIDPFTGAGTVVGATGSPVISGLAFVLTPLTPTDIEVDFSALDASDGNGVFEPGETVEAAPFWHSEIDEPVFADGTLSNFTGPAGASYDIVFNGVGYEFPPGESSSCQDPEGGCYELEIQLAGTERPALHWDATVEEELQYGIADFVRHLWTLHLGDSFTDVPRANLFYPAIETLLHSGVTSGCVGSQFCPGGVVTRAQMPVFVLRALEGPAYVAPACVEGEEAFGDVPFDSPFCPWITDLFHRGVVAGCGPDVYCPTDPVSRAQMAIFLLKTLEGSAYDPPDCTGLFDDVACPSVFADWIEDLANRDITAGCDGDNYCPGASVSRAQMASFIAKTFGLTLYGP